MAQTQAIESLKQEINTAPSDNYKLQAIFALCKKKQSIPTDTLYRYVAIAKALSIKKNNTHDVILCDYYIMNYLIKLGLDDSCVAICNKYINQLSGNNSEKELYFDFLNYKGFFFVRATKYKEALAIYYKMLSEAESVRDTLNEGGAQTGIGWVYMEMNQNREALQWFFKVIQTTGNNLNKYGSYYSVLYSDIASIYNNSGKNDSAEFYINKAIVLARKYENLRYEANSLAIEAEIFSDLKKDGAAESALLEAINIRKQIGDPFYVISDMTTLALFYNHTGRQEKGIAVCKEGIQMANQYGLSSKLLILYDALASNYQTGGNLVKYGETLKQIINLKDSVYQKNSADALAELQTKYDVQKQQNIIIQQKLDLITKNYFIYGSFTLLLLALIISYLIFRDYRRRQKMKMEKMLMEEKRLSIRAVSSAEEKERRRIAADLHDNMGAYASAITANVDDMLYQKENMNVASLQILKKNASEIMINLRDTIWALNKDEISITGVSDRFKTYLQKIISSYPDVAIEFNENIKNNIMLTPPRALHIFLILQEAVTNALKHSDAQIIEIDFYSTDQINISIKDNGKGIDFTAIKNNGNGLVNINSRAREAG
ncbi:MAG: ATP-binding protein, partial [Ginsengibacter sp.]